MQEQAIARGMTPAAGTAPAQDQLPESLQAACSAPSLQAWLPAGFIAGLFQSTGFQFPGFQSVSLGSIHTGLESIKSGS